MINDFCVGYEKELLSVCMLVFLSYCDINYTPVGLTLKKYAGLTREHC